MGTGHPLRINAVLRAFRHTRLAEVVQVPVTVVYAPDPQEKARGLRREILDRAISEQSSRETAAAGLSEVENHQARLEELRALRGARVGQ